mgnify:FL=1
MKYTGSEIRKQTFKTKLHGYEIAEVTNFLNDIAVEWDNITAQNTTLKEKVIELETKLKDYISMEKAIEQTFMQAQETSGKAIENARKEAELITHEAELKAGQMVEKARNDLLALKEEISILEARRNAISNRLKMLLQSELETLKTMETESSDSKLQNGTIENKEENKKSEIEDIVKNIS